MIEVQASVVLNERSASDTYSMVLCSPEIVNRAKAGQFVMIRIRPGSDPLLPRPFSIAGVEDDKFVVLYRVVGKGTAIMAEIQEGEKLPVIGPLGKGFDLPGDGQKPILVAGGMGVAPLLFLAQALEAFRVDFLLGFGTKGEIVNVDRVAHSSMKVSVATDDGSEGYPGRVTRLLEEVIENHKIGEGSLTVFSCGPKPMLKRVAELVRDHRIPCQVSLEASMGCGVGACMGCAVGASGRENRSYHYVCKDGPVFPIRAIDWDTY